MWRKIGRIFGAIVGWGAILAYILYASHLAQEHRATQCVEDIVISISDSTDTRQFASTEQMYKRLQRSGLKIENEPVDSVDAVKISDYISQNGFVRESNVYVTYSGKLYVDIKQHEPVMRLLCGGINSYITEEGCVFRSPQGSAYYTAVVTGGYKPLFDTRYEGDINSHYAKLIDVENEKLAKLGEEFARLKGERFTTLARKSDLRKQSKRGVFESRESHEQRKVGIEVEMAECNKHIAQCNAKKRTLERQQQGVEMRKKRLQERYNDFANLINFVSQVGNDSFWSAEIVQFVADTTSMGEISLRLVPRSGDFIIEFGTLADSNEKLQKLGDFYDDGLSRMGWNLYKTIDVRYNKQVICTK